MNKQSKVASGLLALVCALAVAACGQSGSPSGIAGMLQHLKPLTGNCGGKSINAYDGVDGSATGRGNETLISGRLQAVHDLADQVAACGGFLKVVLFSSSQAENATLGEAEFPTSSGTETARLIAANKVEEDLLAEVEETLPKALREVNPNGTDVLSQLQLAREFARQRPTGQLYVQLETDGINTVKPVVMNTPSFTPVAAHAAAQRVALPDLSGATVRIFGLGQTTSAKRPSTQRIDALTTFYELACRRAHAASCLATTDYTTGG
jgi:hypothetical protein